METNDMIEKCVELSTRCIEECKATALLSQNLPNMQKCAELCLRCADECEFLISTCMKNSISNPEYYDHCYEACAACAKECEKYEASQFRNCAEICRKFQLTYIFQSYQSHQPIVHHAKAG